MSEKKTISVMIPFIGIKNLRLVHHSTKRPGMNNSITITLKGIPNSNPFWTI